MTANARPGGAPSPRSLPRLLEQPLARVVAYYVLVVAGVVILTRLVPAAGPLLNAGIADAAPGGSDLLGFGGATPGAAGPAPATYATPLAEALAALIAMGSALALILPVAWVYVFTRQRKGFRQSVVQTLIILPVVVAGVVILVKNSIALAFSLGGIVAAVSFRNTLRDTKDAVCIFLAIGVGLATGVQATAVAFALSVVFNAVLLLLWWTDFGRAPAELRGAPARQRLRRVRAPGQPTNAVVSLLDRELLKSLSPEQLDSLAARAWHRREQALDRAGERAEDEAGDGARVRRLRVAVPGDVAAARAAVEQVLEQSAKRWKLTEASRAADGGNVLEYRVRTKRSVPAERLAAEVRARAEAFRATVEIE